MSESFDSGVKHFGVSFSIYEPTELDAPFVYSCRGIVSSEIDELRPEDIRRLFYHTHRFAFIGCNEIPPERAEKFIQELEPRLGTYAKEQTVKFKIVESFYYQRDAVLDADGTLSVRIIYDIFPNGIWRGLSFNIEPSGK